MNDTNTPDNNTSAPGSNPNAQNASNVSDTLKVSQREPAGGAKKTEWGRPVAVAKDRHFRAWCIFLGLVCFSIAVWRPLRTLYYQYGYTQNAEVVERDADHFIAIAYYGVSDKAQGGSQDVSTQTFAEQLRLMQERGYTPISLSDVRAFYKEGKPLPRKAVLTTFEQSRKSSYFDVRNILHANRWTAVMGVNTAPIHSHDAQALLWPYLRDMLSMGYWDLASQSDQGFTPIQTSQTGHTGAFFSKPQWLVEKDRYELPAEFDMRIGEDHHKVIAEFEKETKTKPIAFFFPYGDYGQYDEKAQVVRVTNLQQVGANYELGFSLGSLALNTSNSNPRCLNRLLVDPKWTPEQFISKLDTFWPSELAYTLSGERIGVEHWISEWGDLIPGVSNFTLCAVAPADPVLTLAQEPRSATTGAKAWLAGSDTFEDGYLSLRFNLRNGRFGVYLRSTAYNSYVYVSVDDSGTVSVRQRQPGVDEVILASDSLRDQRSRGHDLLIYLRDNLLFVRLDGQTLFGGSVALLGEKQQGLISVGVWDVLPGIASVEILDARLMRRRYSLVTWASDTIKDEAYLMRWLAEYSYQFNVIAPPFIDIYEGMATTYPQWDISALHLFARANEMRVQPRVLIRNAELITKVAPDDIVKLVSGLGVDGLYVDASTCTSDQVQVLVSWLISLHKALNEKEMRLSLKLPQTIEALQSSGNIFHLLPSADLVGTFQTTPFGLDTDRVLGITHVLPDEPDETLALYYQLSSMLSSYNDVSLSAQREDMRQRGFDAFVAGNYTNAISIWQEWSRSDPRSAEAQALIGDAWMRAGEPEKALASYLESLAINPGQMNLAIRRARLLESQGRLEESAEILNVYARTFPEDPAVIMAQAQWLDRNRQRNAARSIMQALVQKRPQDIEARLTLQSLLDSSSERYANIHELLAIGRKPDTYMLGFGQDIAGAELLAIPESAVMFDFIRENAANHSNQKTKDFFSNLLPLTEPVSENFSMDKLSDNWIVFGGFKPSASGRYDLEAAATVSEASLRLKRSELLRDGFVEVTLDETAGAFWLYARRSSNAMLRFGYDNEGNIWIQSWKNGELGAFEGRPWQRPPGSFQLRLEIRGDGVMGYVNGQPAFMTPLLIPSDIAYGWWGAAPFSPDIGSARARISRIEGGPLSPMIALMPRLPFADILPALDRIRPHARKLSVLAPFAFRQLADGTVPKQPEMDLTPYKMFCAFHRLRLLPVVDVAYLSETIPDNIAQLIQANRFYGVILRVRTMPDKAWFARMEAMAEQTPADIIVIEQEDPFWPVTENVQDIDIEQELAYLEKLVPTQMREIQRSRLLLSPSRDHWSVQHVPYSKWIQDAGEKTDKQEKNMPPLVVFPRRFNSSLIPIIPASLTEPIQVAPLRLIPPAAEAEPVPELLEEQ